MCDFSNQNSCKSSLFGWNTLPDTIPKQIKERRLVELIFWVKCALYPPISRTISWYNHCWEHCLLIMCDFLREKHQKYVHWNVQCGCDRKHKHPVPPDFSSTGPCPSDQWTVEEPIWGKLHMNLENRLPTFARKERLCFRNRNTDSKHISTLPRHSKQKNYQGRVPPPVWHQ